MFSTATLHAVAKAAGIKNLKAAGRTRDVILAELVAIKGWGHHDAATIDFLVNGGTITECKPAPTPKADIGNQASAGKTKRKGKTATEKSKLDYIAAFLKAFEEMGDFAQTDLKAHMESKGVFPILADTPIWGNSGLCGVVTDWGLKVKVVEGAGAKLKLPKEAPVAKVTKEKTKRPNRVPPAAKEGLVTLASLCEKHNIDGKVARRKLRTAMDKPAAGWNFAPDAVHAIELIITK